MLTRRCAQQAAAFAVVVTYHTSFVGKQKAMAKKTSNNFLGRARLLWIVALTPVFLIVGVLGTAMLSGLPDVDLLANPKVSLASQVVSTDGRTL